VRCTRRGGRFDLVKLEKEISGQQRRARELPAGAFDRARTFRFPGDAEDAPAWVASSSGATGRSW
jgi:hypothetical protein